MAGSAHWLWQRCRTLACVWERGNCREQWKPGEEVLPALNGAWQQHSDLAGSEIRAVLPVHLSGCCSYRQWAVRGDESKQHVIRCFHFSLPSTGSCASLFSFCSCKWRKDQSQEYFEGRRDIALSVLPSQTFRPGGEGGMQVVNNNKREGRRRLALGEFRLGQFDLSQSTLSAWRSLLLTRFSSCWMRGFTWVKFRPEGDMKIIFIIWSDMWFRIKKLAGREKSWGYPFELC